MKVGNIPALIMKESGDNDQCVQGASQIVHETCCA